MIITDGPLVSNTISIPLPRIRISSIQMMEETRGISNTLKNTPDYSAFACQIVKTDGQWDGECPISLYSLVNFIEQPMEEIDGLKTRSEM